MALESPLSENLLDFMSFIMDHVSDLDLTSVRGLVVRLRMLEGKVPGSHLRLTADRLYSVGVDKGFYPAQDVDSRVLTIHAELTPFEMESLVEEFMGKVVRVVPADTIKMLSAKLDAGTVPANRELNVFKFHPVTHGRIPYTTGLEFLDHAATSTVSMARKRLKHALESLCPKVYLTEGPIDVYSLVRYLAARAEGSLGQ
jgi:hypothetical protein